MAPCWSESPRREPPNPGPFNPAPCGEPTGPAGLRRPSLSRLSFRPGAMRVDRPGIVLAFAWPGTGPDSVTGW